MVPCGQATTGALLDAKASVCHKSISKCRGRLLQIKMQPIKVQDCVMDISLFLSVLLNQGHGLLITDNILMTSLSQKSQRSLSLGQRYLTLNSNLEHHRSHWQSVDSLNISL